jgi:hypothetical protein
MSSSRVSGQTIFFVRLRVFVTSWFAMAAVVTIASLSPQSAIAPGVTRVLFVGNSLTTVNDVPAIVGRLAAASNQRFSYRTVAFDGYSLEDHWNRGDARRAIADGGWSIVVLQQGPSARPESRALLREYVKRFDTEARRVSARTALYMVWPSSDRRADFDDVRLSYATATRDIDGTLLAVGDAWRAAWRRDSRLPLYGADGFHPTRLGSYLAALVMYQSFFHRSPIGLPLFDAPASQAQLLQEAAASVANAR